jgi:hypothetical protein
VALIVYSSFVNGRSRASLSDFDVSIVAMPEGKRITPYG